MAQPRRLAWCARRRRARCALLGAAVAAAQLLPTLELAPLSIRGEGVNWTDAVAGSLPSYLSVRALFPPYWMTCRTPNTSATSGVTAVVLGFWRSCSGRARPVRVRRRWSASSGCSWRWARTTASTRSCSRPCPGFDTFRVPARWLLLWEFGAAVLAAVGADWVGRGGARLAASASVSGCARSLVVVHPGRRLAWQTRRGRGVRAAPHAPRRSLASPRRRSPWAALPHLGRPTLALRLLLA